MVVKRLDTKRAKYQDIILWMILMMMMAVDWLKFAVIDATFWRASAKQAGSPKPQAYSSSSLTFALEIQSVYKYKVYTSTNTITNRIQI